jgi:hypothetical protein
MCMTLVLCLWVSGCQTMTWEHPSASESSFSQDRARCLYEAEVASTSQNSPPTMASAVAQGYGDAMRHNRFFTLCMQAKGYTLRRKE